MPWLVPWLEAEHAACLGKPAGCQGFDLAPALLGVFAEPGHRRAGAGWRCRGTVGRSASPATSPTWPSSTAFYGGPGRRTLAAMSLAGVTLNQFVKIGLIAAVFIVVLKYAVMRLPAPEGLRAAVGTI